MSASLPRWARSILPAPTLASRQWAHALARRCREPAHVAGFLEPSSQAHHVILPLDAGFVGTARELGTSRVRHFAVEPGELCLVGEGGSPTELSWQSQGRASTLDIVELYIDPSVLVAEDAARGSFQIDPTWHVSRDPLLTQLVRSIASELERAESGEETFGELATTLFAAQLQRIHGRAEGPVSRARGGLAPFALRRVREYVAAHLPRPIRLHALAAVAGLSPFHFARAFKASTGLSPHAFVLHCRVTEAKRLLSTSCLPVAEVARRTGFQTTGQLSTRFRAHTGTTPSAFRALSRP